MPVLVIAVEGLRGGRGCVLASDLTRPQALSAIWLSVWTAAVMAAINMVMGTLTAYVLIAYRFPGKRLLNAMIDLPFAIPTLVTGVMLVLLYGPQTAIGTFFEKSVRHAADLRAAGYRAGAAVSRLSVRDAGGAARAGRAGCSPAGSGAYAWRVGLDDVPAYYPPGDSARR